MTDLYNILGIARDATPEEIKKAYRGLAKRYHPDKNPGDEEASRLFKEANEAYEILTNPEKRRAYDLAFAPPESVWDVFSRTNEGISVLETMLPTAPAATQRGMDVVCVADVQADGTLSVVSPAQGEMPIECPSDPAATPWGMLNNFGAAGKNAAEPGKLYVFNPQRHNRGKRGE